jgi:hypothetical protein
MARKTDPLFYPSQEEEAKERQKTEFGFALSRSQSGFRFSLDFKKLLAAIPRSKRRAKGDAVFAKPEKPPSGRKSRALQVADEREQAVVKSLAIAETLRIQMADKDEELGETTKALAAAETESRAYVRKLTVVVEEVAVWRTKYEQLEQKLAVVSRTLAEEERNLATARKHGDKKDVELVAATRKLVSAAEDVKLWKTKAEAVEFKLGEAVAQLAQLAEELAASEKKRKALERDLEVSKGKSVKAAEAAGIKLTTTQEEVTAWKLRAETLDMRLSVSLAKHEETETARQALVGECDKSKQGETSARQSLAAALASLKASTDAATKLRESESGLTAAVEQHACDLNMARVGLEKMRVDRDEERTKAKEARVQNGVLRMRLAVKTSATDVSGDEITALTTKIDVLETTQLERAAEEVRKLAALENARDEATASVELLHTKLAEQDAEFKQTLELRVGRITALELRNASLAEELEGEKFKSLKVMSENKEQTRTLIIKETEIRETKVREVLKQTHLVEINKLVDTHTKQLEDNTSQNASALADAYKLRDEVEKELLEEQGNAKRAKATAAAASAEARKKITAGEEEIARLEALIASDRESRTVEKAQVRIAFHQIQRLFAHTRLTLLFYYRSTTAPRIPPPKRSSR